MPSDRFARFLPLAGVFAGLLLAAGLTLTYSIPNSETSFEETFSWWKDDRGQHRSPASSSHPWSRSCSSSSGRGCSEACGATPATPGMVRSRWWRDPRRCGVHTHRTARRRGSECGARRPSGSRLCAQPTPFVRLADVQRSVGSRATRYWTRSASQRSAAELACMGDHRPRGNTAHADRLSRVALHSAVVDRRRSLALP